MSDKFIIECEECKYNNEIFLSDMDYTSNGTERGMGAEVEHHYSIEYDCCKCGNSIELEYTAWEYPLNTFEASNTVLRGGTMIDSVDEINMFQEIPEEE